MYSGRQRDLRERRSRQDWDAPDAFGQESPLEVDDTRELDGPVTWSIQLNARASAA
jgi:hypothetical protein